jgi:riboflavin synthase
MFTGIIQGLGTIEHMEIQGRRARIRLKAGALAERVHPGDSVSVSGVCLTAVVIDGEALEFDAVKTTVSRTRLGSLKRGSPVNLELALTLADRLGGHLVSGHVDGVGTIRKLDKGAEEWRFRIEAPRDVMRFVMERGSVAVDGISLTVAAVHDTGFEIAVIPHTLEMTTLGCASTGDPVNLEADMISRMVAEQVARLKDKGITLDRLREEGY